MPTTLGIALLSTGQFTVKELSYASTVKAVSPASANNSVPSVTTASFVYSGHGYRVVDQSSVTKSEISFKNASCMTSEELYRQTLKLADADYFKQQPFLPLLITTSNHNPYNYPDGRSDIRPGNGRDGAVRYTAHHPENS